MIKKEKEYLDTQRRKPTRKKAWKQVIFLVWILERDQFLVLTKKSKNLIFKLCNIKCWNWKLASKLDLKLACA